MTLRIGPHVIPFAMICAIDTQRGAVFTLGGHSFEALNGEEPDFEPYYRWLEGQEAK